MKRSDLAALLEVDFTDDQLDAITAPPEPLLIVAGAGSGKTAVMAARVVWLVGTEQVAPDQVLGLTFTNKAAASLNVRVGNALDMAGLIDSTDPGPVVSTYHAFAGQVLADYGLRVGVEPHARVITDAVRAQLAFLTVRRTQLPLRAITGRIVDVARALLALDDALAEQGLGVDVLEVHDRDTINTIESLVKVPPKPVLKVAETAAQRLELGALVAEFRAAKLTRDLIDFADHTRLALDIVKTQPDVVATLQELFPAVLLDEYQDTSVAQRLFLSNAFGAGHDLTAVGDPLQAIYGWRGASVDNIESFPVHFPRASGARAIELSLAANMRSGRHILTAANEVSAPLRADTAIRPLTQGNPKRGPGGVRLALHETWGDELAWVVDRIAEQLDAGVKPDDIAVLTRRGTELVEVDAALAARGIPTSVASLDGLLSVPEVIEVVSTLEVLADPTANIALVRLLTGARWRIGHRDLAFLARRAAHIAQAHQQGVPDDATLSDQVISQLQSDPVDVVAIIDAVDDPGDAPLSDEAAARCAELSRELRYLRRFVDEPLADLIGRVAAVTGLDLELASSPSLVGRNRAAVLASLVDVAANFASFDGESSLDAFLTWLQAGEDLDARPSLSIPAAPNSVALLTVHRAKGLEWPVVVLPALSTSVFPSDRGRSKHTTTPKALPHEVRADGAALPRDPEPNNKDLQRFDEEMKAVSLVEELRLGYVASTRAETLLIASGHWWGPSQKTRRGPSQILRAMHDEVLGGAGTVDVWVEAPDDEATNPNLDELVAVPYTQQSTSAEALRRQTLADAVTAIDVDALPADAVSASFAGLSGAAAQLFAAWDDDAERVISGLLADQSRVRHVVLPSTLTASQVQRLAEDPAAFARRLARPMPQAPRPAATRGSELHRAIEGRYGTAALMELDELLGAGDPESEVADVSDLLAAFDASPWSTRSPKAVEWPFALTIGARLLRGRVDAVFDGASVPVSEVPYTDPDIDADAGVVLVDWKTSRPGSGDPLQLAVYRLAWARAHGLDPALVRACFVHWPSGVIVAPHDLASAAEIATLLAPEA